MYIDVFPYEQFIDIVAEGASKPNKFLEDSLYKMNYLNRVAGNLAQKIETPRYREIPHYARFELREYG